MIKLSTPLMFSVPRRSECLLCIHLYSQALTSDPTFRPRLASFFYVGFPRFSPRITPPRAYGSTIIDSTCLSPEMIPDLTLLHVRSTGLPHRHYPRFRLHEDFSLLLIHDDSVSPFLVFPSHRSSPRFASRLGHHSVRSIYTPPWVIQSRIPNLGGSISPIISLYHLQSPALPSLHTVTPPNPVICLLCSTHVSWPLSTDIPFSRCSTTIGLYSDIHPPNEHIRM